MKKTLYRLFGCLTVVSLLFGAQLAVLANNPYNPNDPNDPNNQPQKPKQETKYKYNYSYNTVKLQNPTMPASIKPAVAKYNQGNFVGALQDLEDLTDQDPDNAYAKYYLAMTYAKLGYREDALKTYREVGDSSYNYALSYYARIAAKCIENPNDLACLPPAKNVPAKHVEEQKEDELIEVVYDKDGKATVKVDEIGVFLKSGKSVHPAASDRITRERMERKIQADQYAQKQAAGAANAQQNAANAANPANTNTAN